MNDKSHLPLGKMIRQARGELKQTALEMQFQLPPGTISRWENGHRFRITRVVELRGLCDAIGIDFRDFLETWVECEPNESAKAGLGLLLSDFQQVFRRDLHGLHVETLIMGDRRNNPRSHVTDFALQVSISDLFFLAELKRPIQIWFDKLVVLEQPDVVPKSFKRNDVLVVGSPAVNLASRLVNPTAAFRFHIDNEIVQLEKDLSERGPQLAEADYNDPVTQDDIDKIIDGNRGQGFVDPFEPRVSYRERSAIERGILTFAENPWNPERLAIVAAGQGGAATAASLKLLAAEDCFADHPLGGVFVVNDVRGLTRATQFENLNPQWVTNGYSIDDYVRAVDAHEHCNAEMLRRLVDLVRAKA